jgi:hypothetical protein
MTQPLDPETEAAKQALGMWLVEDYRRRFHFWRHDGQYEYRLIGPFGRAHVGLSAHEPAAIYEALKAARESNYG